MHRGSMSKSWRASSIWRSDVLTQGVDRRHGRRWLQILLLYSTHFGKMLSGREGGVVLDISPLLSALVEIASAGV